METKNDYDAIIIGAGIGGLVCGCYLAKAGKKVAIMEKNYQVGGCCSSFYRDGLLFDSCVHYIGGCRDNGILNQILRELNVIDKLKIEKPKQSMTVYADEKCLNVYKDIETNIEELSKYFSPQKNNLREFFDVISNSNYLALVTKLKNITFDIFVRNYIKDKELYNLFSYFIFQAAGLPCDKISALFSVLLLRDFIVDGGYYPTGGVRSLAEALKATFETNGGKVLLNSEVKKVDLGDTKSVTYCIAQKDISSLFAHSVIFNTDVMHALSNILDSQMARTALDTVKDLQPSISSLILYLKLDSNHSYPAYSQFISIKQDSKDLYYSPYLKGDFNNLYSSCFFSREKNVNKAVVNLMVPYNNKEYWEINKNILINKLIDSFCGSTGIGREKVKLITASTPLSIEKWIGSYKGANYGWAPTVSQVFPNFKLDAKIPDIYFVGHWVGYGHGVSTVAYTGKMASKYILEKTSR